LAISFISPSLPLKATSWGEEKKKKTEEYYHYIIHDGKRGRKKKGVLV